MRVLRGRVSARQHDVVTLSWVCAGVVAAVVSSKTAVLSGKTAESIHYVQWTREVSMRLKQVMMVALAGAALWGFAAGEAMAQNEQFIPRLVYRTGPYAPNGIPFADGYAV
jgi:hypothetical protein